MGYLDIMRPKDESSIDSYPQKVCDYIISRYFTRAGFLLDIGSGKGNHLVGFSRRGMIVSGVDKLRECIDATSLHALQCDLEYDMLPFQDNYFDYVFSVDVLEHIQNTENVIKETCRVLRPGGIVVHLVATDSPYFWDEPTHVRPFSKLSLERAYRMWGFTDVEVTPFYQIPFLWRHPRLEFLARIMASIPYNPEWKTENRSWLRVFYQYSKAKLLLGKGVKPDAI